MVKILLLRFVGSFLKKMMFLLMVLIVLKLFVVKFCMVIFNIFVDGLVFLLKLCWVRCVDIKGFLYRRMRFCFS